MDSFTPPVPTRPGLYYRRRCGTGAPPEETVIYYVDGRLVFEIEETRVGEGGEMRSHYEEVRVSEVGDAYLWRGPLDLFDT